MTTTMTQTPRDRVIEYVDHLHEHFLDPVVIGNGHYTAPTVPGFSTQMRPESIAAYRYPEGAFRVADRQERQTNR